MQFHLLLISIKNIYIRQYFHHQSINVMILIYLNISLYLIIQNITYCLKNIKESYNKNVMSKYIRQSII